MKFREVLKRALDIFVTHEVAIVVASGVIVLAAVYTVLVTTVVE